MLLLDIEPYPIERMDQLLSWTKRIMPRAAIRAGVSAAAFVHWKVNYPHISFRSGSTDFEAYKDVFIRRNYALPGDLRPSIVVDGGAYVGFSSLYFADKYPTARIIAIEPEPSNFSALRANTRGVPRIEPVHAGLWHKPGSLKLRDTGTGEWGFRTAEAENGVPARTVESVVSEYGRIDILKLDIEGAEAKLFEDPRWLHNVGILAIEIHDGCRPLIQRGLQTGRWSTYTNNEIFVFINEEFPAR